MATFDTRIAVEERYNDTQREEEALITAQVYQEQDARIAARLDRLEATLAWLDRQHERRQESMHGS